MTKENKIKQANEKAQGDLVMMVNWNHIKGNK